MYLVPHSVGHEVIQASNWSAFAIVRNNRIYCNFFADLTWSDFFFLLYGLVFFATFIKLLFYDFACLDENELDIPTNDSENEIDQEEDEGLEYYVEGKLFFALVEMLQFI